MDTENNADNGENNAENSSENNTRSFAQRHGGMVVAAVMLVGLVLLIALNMN